MRKDVLEKALAVNAKLAGDAAFVEIGRTAARLLVKPAKAKLPDNLAGSFDGLTGHALVLGGVSLANEHYDIPGMPEVQDALAAAFAADAVIALGDTIADAITRRKVLLGPASSGQPAQNIAKGGEKVVSNVFAGPPGKVDPRYAKPVANTAAGGENVIDAEVIEDEKKSKDNLPNFDTYWPTSRDELFKDEKNLLVCPDPLGDHKSADYKAHSKQKDKFNPWKSENLHGYRSDLDGLMICGGCRDRITAEYHKAKKAEEAEIAKSKKNEELQRKLDANTAEYDDLAEKLKEAKNYEQQQITALTANPKNEYVIDALANVQSKIKTIEEKMLALEMESETIEAEIKGEATVVNTPPVVVENKATGGENASAPTNNGKTSALTHVKGKKGKGGKRR